MKTLALLMASLLGVGCGQKAQQDAAVLDALLATGRIDRIEFIADLNYKTNVFLDERAIAITRLLASTNRVMLSTDPFIKNSSSGRVLFYQGNNYLRGLTYVPEYDALSSGQYYFGLNGTNEVRHFFE